MIKQIILHNFLLEKRNIIACTCIMTAVMLFFSIASATYIDKTNTMRVNYSTAVGFADVTIWFCLVYTASRMFRYLNDKKTAIPFLMLPASNKDKFLANCIMGIGGTFAMFITALLSADVLQAIFNIATKFTAGSLTVHFVEDLLYSQSFIFNGIELLNNTFWTILMLFWTHAIFTLGSTLFRKYQLIKTVLSLLAAFMLLMILISCMAVPSLYNKDVTIHFLVDPKIMFYVTISVVILGTTIGAYYLAYRRFCNKTIV